MQEATSLRRKTKPVPSTDTEKGFEVQKLQKIKPYFNEVEEMWLLYNIQGPVLGGWAWACLRKEERITAAVFTHGIIFYSIILKINPKPCHYLHFQIHLPLESPADQLSKKQEPPYSYTHLPHTWQDRGVLLLVRP